LKLNLPRAVIEAERKADEALQRLAASKQQQPQAEGETPPTDTPAPQSEPESAAPAPAPSEPAPQTTPQAEGDEKWEARYKTLHGKYNAEVPRLHAAIKERDAKLNSLTEEVEALKAKAATPRESLIKPEEVNEYGEPLVDLIRRAARDEVQGKDSEIADLKRKLDQVQVATAETKEVSFYERLAASVPDWMALNDDPAFHDWLGEFDELAGMQRQALLSAAEEKRDADRVARFFNAFKKVQQDKSAEANASLASQVTPVGTRSDSPPASKKIWTRAEIADFYARDRRGEYSDEKAAAIDQEIQLAIRETRVR
jgi:uncharacterized protein YaaR (DUF327 family)